MRDDYYLKKLRDFFIDFSMLGDSIKFKEHLFSLLILRDESVSKIL